MSNVKRIFIVALAVFCIFSLASESEATNRRGQFRGPRQIRRSQPIFQLNLGNDNHRRRSRAEQRAFEEGVRAAQRAAELRRFQQFRHHN